MKHLTYCWALAIFATNTCLHAFEQKPDRPNNSSEQSETVNQSLLSDFHKTEQLKGKLGSLIEFQKDLQREIDSLEGKIKKIKSGDTPLSNSARLLSPYQTHMETLRKEHEKIQINIQQTTSDLKEVNTRRSEFDKEVRENPTKENLFRKIELLEAEIQFLRKRNSGLRNMNEEMRKAAAIAKAEDMRKKRKQELKLLKERARADAGGR